VLVAKWLLSRLVKGLADCVVGRKTSRRASPAEILRPESAREGAAGPIVGYFLVAYTHARWPTGDRFVYVKACLSRPVSYWDATDCSFKICIRALVGDADVALALALEQARCVLEDLLPPGGR
jgi:hypothetical protein